MKFAMDKIWYYIKNLELGFPMGKLWYSTENYGTLFYYWKKTMSL